MYGRRVGVGAFIVALAATTASQTSVVHHELSGSMVSGMVGDVSAPELSPTGDRALYRVALGQEVAGGTAAARATLRDAVRGALTESSTRSTWASPRSA
jgi:hypothetical protein